MNTKLIFFDIDGTLITEGHDHYAPESTLKALTLLRQNGHICLINTGRPYAALDAVIRSIPVDGYVCGCGTYIRMGDDILFSYHLEKELCRKILVALDSCGIEWMLENDDGIYCSANGYKSRIASSIESFQNKLPQSLRFITPEDYPNVQFEKFLVVLTPDADFETFRSLFQNDLTFIDRGHAVFEIIPQAYSKATGMKFMEAHFGIDHKDTIAVGDSTNDVAMLEYAHLSILRGGAEKSLLQYADYVTTPVAEDGIFNAFRHYQMI